MTELGGRRAFDQRLLERYRVGVDRFGAHRSDYELINQLLGYRRQRRQAGDVRVFLLRASTEVKDREDTSWLGATRVTNCKAFGNK